MTITILGNFNGGIVFAADRLMGHRLFSYDIDLKVQFYTSTSKFSTSPDNYFFVQAGLMGRQAYNKINSLSFGEGPWLPLEDFKDGREYTLLATNLDDSKCHRWSMRSDGLKESVEIAKDRYFISAYDQSIRARSRETLSQSTDTLDEYAERVCEFILSEANQDRIVGGVECYIIQDGTVELYYQEDPVIDTYTKEHTLAHLEQLQKGADEKTLSEIEKMIAAINIRQ